MEKGMEKGIKEGIKKGIEKERMNAVERMIQAGATKEQIVSFGYRKCTTDADICQVRKYTNMIFPVTKRRIKRHLS